MSSVTRQRSDTNGPRPQLVMSGDDGAILALAYLPDGRRVVTTSRAGTVKVWNVENGEQQGTSMEHKSYEVYSLAVTRDGTKIISGSLCGWIKVWDAESHEPIREWTHCGGACFDISVSPDDQLVAVGSGWTRNGVAICTMEGKLVNDAIHAKNSIGPGSRSIAFSPDGNKLACVWDGAIRVHDVENGALVLGPLKDHKAAIRCVLWSRNGSILFSGSSDKTIRCWNSDTGEQIGQPWTGHIGRIESLSLSPDGSILASASMDTVCFWDATSGHPIGQPLQHDEAVTVVCFSPSGEFVASAGWNGKIYLWRVPWLDSVESRAMPPWHATPCTLRNAPFSMHLRRTIYTFPVLRKCWIAILAYMVQIITSSVVPSSHPSSPVRDSNSKENDPVAASSVSDEVDVEYILPHPSLGLDERERMFELRLRKMLDLATSTGLRVPDDIILSSLPVDVQNTLGLASIADVGWNSTHTSRIESSMSVFRCASSGNAKKIRKIDKIKQKLVEMLREIGFKLSNGRLPWSTLEGDLLKRGYMIVNWPQGVDRDRDKGVSGISAEDADKLYDALFVDDDRIQFVRCEKFASSTDGVTSLAVASGSDGPRESNYSSAGKQLSRFRVTTAEEYPNKRRRV
ncbi:WD40 repeat-like protein [Imleria badia]|nr:WD40 repeat-like protein [Imleria badia]